MTAMSRQKLLELPATVTPETAFAAVGCGRTAGYALIRSGQWPTRVIRLGRSIRVPTAELLALLGVAPDTGGADDDDGHPAP